MSSYVRYIAQVPDSSTTMVQVLNLNTTYKEMSLNDFINFNAALVDSAQQGYVTLSAGATQAAGTVTFATPQANDTITVNGRVYTAVASGATGQQFNIGASNTITAANFATVVNADTNAAVNNIVHVTSALAVATITIQTPGTIGNYIVVSSSNGTRLAVVSPTGGTNGTYASSGFGLPVNYQF